MKMTLDIGNTAVKWGAFEGRTLTAHGTAKDAADAKRQWKEAHIAPERVMVCASGKEWKTADPKWEHFQYPYDIPVELDYKTPETLGADRVADACGAWALHPGEPCLIIDAGTCITVDFLDADGIFHGGAIMPGLRMNLQALHTFTAKLPLIELEGVSRAPLLGRTTEDSIVAGTLGATMLALAGFVSCYKVKTPELHVLLTGGDAGRLTASGTSGWELVPHLTLMGLNEAMEN